MFGTAAYCIASFENCSSRTRFYRNLSYLGSDVQGRTFTRINYSLSSIVFKWDVLLYLLYSKLKWKRFPSLFSSSFSQGKVTFQVVFSFLFFSFLLLIFGLCSRSLILSSFHLTNVYTKICNIVKPNPILMVMFCSLHCFRV